jgi:flavoprotein
LFHASVARWPVSRELQAMEQPTVSDVEKCRIVSNCVEPGCPGRAGAGRLDAAKCRKVSNCVELCRTGLSGTGRRGAPERSQVSKSVEKCRIVSNRAGTGRTGAGRLSAAGITARVIPVSPFLRY